MMLFWVLHDSLQKITIMLCFLWLLVKCVLFSSLKIVFWTFFILNYYCTKIVDLWLEFQAVFSTEIVSPWNERPAATICSWWMLASVWLWWERWSISWQQLRLLLAALNVSTTQWPSIPIEKQLLFELTVTPWMSHHATQHDMLTWTKLSNSSLQLTTCQRDPKHIKLDEPSRSQITFNLYLINFTSKQHQHHYKALLLHEHRVEHDESQGS